MMSKIKTLLLPVFALAIPFALHAQSVVTPELMQQFQNRGGGNMNMNMLMGGGGGSSVITPEMILRAQTQKIAAEGGDVTKAEELAKAEEEAKKAEESGKKAEDAEIDEDSNEYEEDSFGVKRRRGRLSYSVYELMFKGVDILPADVLPYIRMYGHSTFVQRGKIDVKPGDMGSVPVDYPIKIGDEIKVHLWGRINQEHMLKVDRNGSVNIPHIGPVSVAGLPFGTMQRTITDKLKNIEGVNVSLSMGELRPIGIYVVGEVRGPGFHTVSPLTNVTNALYTAGGVTTRGSLRQVQLKRNGKLVAEVDYYDFLNSGNDKSGLRLQSGDVIVVPIVKQMVAVVGNVRRSALYELKAPTKLAEILDLAGGVSPAAWTNRVQVERFKDNAQRIVLDIGAADISKSDFMVIDGDVINVFPVLSKDANAVFLKGNVVRPGKYEYRKGMRIHDVITGYGDLLPESYFEYAVVMRRTYPSYLEKVLTFNLGEMLNDVNSDDNMLLEPADNIVIYHRDFFDPNRTVSVDGAVTKPGTKRLLENMTVRDLILQVGGLKDDASTERGELYRRRFDGESVSTEKITFNIMDAMLAHPEHNKVLRRGDRVFIRSKKDWEPERKVTLSGQVVYPGTYMIFEGEALGDLIKRAGGFREEAYLPAALFIRKSVKEREEQRIKQYSKDLEMNMVRLSIEMASKGQNASALFEQQMILKNLNESKVLLGRVMIDMTDEHQYKTFTLEDGDELFIPRDLNTVSVLGDVYNEGTFRHDTRKTKVSHYLGSAGGALESANKKNMYVIKANGFVISNQISPIMNMALQPGDVVVVPTKIRYPNNYKLFLDTADATMKIGSFLIAIVTLFIVMNAEKK